MSEPGDSGRTSRRRFLAALSAGAVAGVAGCTGGGGSSPETITAEKPNEDGEASLGELRWLLANNGTETYRLDVTEMTYDSDGVISLTYRSRAKEAEQGKRTEFHVGEVGQVLQQYAIYVDADGESGEAKGDELDARVENTYRGQPEGYHIDRAWAEKLNAGATNREVLGQVLQTGVVYGTTYPQGTTTSG